MTFARSLAVAAFALSAALPVSAEPGPATTTKTFADWLVRCPTSPVALPCDTVQLLIEPKSKQRILSVSVAYDPAKAQNVVRIVLPLGIWLPKGVTITAGATKLEKVVVRRCEQFGCVVEGLLDPKLQEAMRKGGDAKITVFDPAGKPLDLKFSLAGFSDAQEHMIAETKKVKPLTPAAPAPAKPN